MTNTDLIKRIALVDEAHAETMAEMPTDFKVESLPFYRKFKLLHATVNLPQRPIQLRYADDGSRIIVLAAGPDRIYEVNKLENLRLQNDHVLAYLRFFFENSGGNSPHIVETEKEVRWLGESGQDSEAKSLKSKAVILIHPAKIAPISEGSFFVNATGIHGRDLVEFSAKVRPDGQVETLAERILAANLPVAEIAW